MPITLTTISPTSDPLHRASKWSVVTPPVARPLTWAQIKAHLRVQTDDEQAYAETLIDAVTDYAEDRLAASLMQRTLRATFYDGEPLVLPRGPLIAIVGITDRDDAAVASYELQHAGNAARVVLTGSSGGYPYTVTYTAGHASAGAIPAAIRVALMMHVATLFENRATVSDKAMVPVPHSLDAFYGLKSRKVCVG